MTNQLQAGIWTGSPLLVVLAFLLMSLSVSQATAQDAAEELVGSWQVTAQSSEGEKQSVLKFARSGDTIEGTIKPVDEDSENALKNIKLEGATVSFESEKKRPGSSW